MYRQLRATGDSDESDEGEDSDVGSVNSEAALGEANERVRRLQGLAAKQDRPRRLFRTQCGLAMSVATWVVLFGLPMISIRIYKLVFGYRGSIVRADLSQNASLRCHPTFTGKVRNVAEPNEEVRLVQWTRGMAPWDDELHPRDEWCGVLNGHYLDYWPNVAQLIIFSVSKSTGTTVKLAWQGIVGTYFACLNVVLMQQLYPTGAKGHLCNPPTGYTAIFHGDGRFFWKLTSTFEEARRLYLTRSDHGGLDARAIFRNNGSVIPGYLWYDSDEVRGMMLEQFQRLQGGHCAPGMVVRTGYSQWVCLLDVVGVLFLFLISRSATITIMFGMSWHVYFMMHFMNPSIGAAACRGWDCAKGDTEQGAVFRTTLLGAAVSVLVTLTVSLVLPVRNLRNLEDDSLAITQTVTEVWRDSLSYLTGHARSAKRFHIASRIAGIRVSVSKAQDDVDGAWWETFDQGTWGAKRLLLKEFDGCTSDIRDVLSCLANCVLTEDFGGEHTDFCASMAGPMEALEREVEELMYMLLQSCRDGAISESESRAIQSVVHRVKRRQMDLVGAFHEASPGISRALAEEVIYAFALSFWARKLTDFAEPLIALASRGCSLLYTAKAGFCALWSSVRETWSPRRMFCDREHVAFAVRNLLSISIVYIMAYFTPSGSVFEQYSSTMPATLSLLVVADGAHQIGSMVYRNIHRLIAVVLGKVLPVLVTWAFFLFPCGSNDRLALQLATTWLYVYIFTYIYYASPMWGYVGCLIAGFGVYQLLAPCSADPSLTFLSRYREIGAVTFAIFVQGAVHSALSGQTPVELELRALRRLGRAFSDGFGAFFDNDLTGVQIAAREAASRLEAAQTLLRECDPKMKVASCGERDFRLKLCTEALQFCEKLLSDLDLLAIAAKDWAANESVRRRSRILDSEMHLADILTDCAAMKEVRSELIPSINSCWHLLLALLAAEDPPEDVHTGRELEAAPALYKQAHEHAADLRAWGRDEEQWELTSDWRARANVMLRALENAQRHLALLTERCLAEPPV